MFRTRGEKVYRVFNTAFLLCFSLIMLAPMWHVAMLSLSDATKAFGGGFYLVPKGFSLNSYKTVLSNPNIISAYANTVFVVVVGTMINVVMTYLAAYPLSIKGLRGKKFINYFIYLTMLFSGGLIPFYMVVRGLGMIDSLWSLIIPTACGGYYVFVLRNFINTIPASLFESARIDGASELTILTKITIPLSLPSLAVISLMYGVGNWNSWFNCIIFINDYSKYTLQPILRQILFKVQIQDFFNQTAGVSVGQTPEVVKMATVMAATIPILVIYPFFQKYFVKGMMLGAVRE